jgi:hypothetical protein
VSDDGASSNFLKEVIIQKYDRGDLDVYTMKDLVAATLERENELKQTHCNLTAIGEHRRAVSFYFTNQISSFFLFSGS